jgi:CRISPR-associated protein Csb1
MPTSATEISPLRPAELLARDESPVVLTATFEPVGGIDRFQPAGFPEVGHVIYKAPRSGGHEENVCIVDSPASMANHLEAVCMAGAHDYELAEELDGMPYVRCVTGDVDGDGKLESRQLVATSLTEGHRIASTYFLGKRDEKTGKWDGKGGRRLHPDASLSSLSFGDELASETAFGIKPTPESKQAHPPPERWWNVFRTIFRYDPNSLVHGVLFPRWQIKIPRVLTAHLEAFGAGRVDRSGVKFDRLGKTTSGQPIFAVDDATAREIRATFILDLSLVRSFGRQKGDETLGLTDRQKEFVVGLALWKIQRLLASPFRFRSGCHLQRVSLREGEHDVAIDVNIAQAVKDADFDVKPRVTDVWWPSEELYREGKDGDSDGGDEAELESEE